MPDAWLAKLDVYLDGELSSEEMRAADTHVRSCPECSAELVRLVHLRRAMRANHDVYKASPEFRRKVLISVSAKPPRGPIAKWYPALASAVLIVLVAIALGVLQFGARSQRRQVFTEVADLHVAVLASANPVDVVSSDKHTVKPWFEGKIPFTFNLPDLTNSEFQLVGGKVSYLGLTPGAQLIFQMRKHRISAFVFQEQHLNTPLPRDSGPENQNSFFVETWANNGLRYFVVGDVSAEDIRNLSGLIRASEAR